MSGHSKWSTIKHKKAANDQKRGQIFTKLIRELTISSRLGGADPEANSRLRSAVLKAKEANMPKDTIERAIKKGSGDLDNVNYEEFSYEGYGPEGVAIFMHIMTDNKNRAASDVRATMSRSGGNLGSNGCVSYMFDKRGVIVFSTEKLNEDKAMEIGIDAGADDIVVDEKNIEVITAPEAFNKVLKAFNDAGFNQLSAEITMVPNTYHDVSQEGVDKVLSLIDKLEELDDIQNVYTNMNIPEEYKV